MDISSLIKAISDPRLNRSGWVQEIIKPGDVFSLKIIDVKDSHRALVDFGKFRALAEIKFPVNVGDELLVKVTNTDGQLRLQLIDPESKALSGRQNAVRQLEILSVDVFSKIQSDAKQAVSQILSLPDQQQPPEHISRALAALDMHFKSIDLSKSITEWLPLLKSKIENAGVFFEAKFEDITHKFAQRPDSEITQALIRSPEIKNILATDLKPILLILKEYLETPDAIAKFLNTKNLSRFKATLDLLLADIANQQGRAVQKHELPNPYSVFSFALPLKENQQKAELKLYCPKKKKKGPKSGFKISLLLDMDRIGAVRADFFLLKKDLSITFFVRDDASKKQFENRFEEIRDSLNPWFDYLILNTVVSEKKIQDFYHEDLDFGSDKQIDLRI